jgi:uncharacterized protein YndB with AHSA1/START domain
MEIRGTLKSTPQGFSVPSFAAVNFTGTNFSAAPHYPVMTNYRCSVMIEGPVAAVYDALTTHAGLQGWWTVTCEVNRRNGGESIFRFGKTYNIMKFESLVPESEVRWRCTEQYHHAPGQLTRPDEWLGTALVFRLATQTPGRTFLEFEHEGLHPGLECFAICERGWDHFLKHSLKNYIETGRGEPYIEPRTAPER